MRKGVPMPRKATFLTIALCAAVAGAEIVPISHVGGEKVKLLPEGQIDVIALPTGNTNTHGKFPPDVRTFLRNWTLEGPTHHFALGVGHHAAELKKLGRALGIETVVVTEKEK